MSMSLLSDVLDSTICPSSKSKTPDDFFAVGCAMIGSWVHGKDPAAQADYQRQGQGIAVLRDFVNPSRPGDGVKDEYRVFGTERTVINDLFVPGHRMDVDGFMHIYFPVPISTPLSSSYLSRDWRFVALAWIAVIDSGLAPSKLVFVAVDAAGRRVMAVVEPDILDAFKTMLKAKPRSVELPGPACIRCVKAEVCDGLQRVLDPHLEGATEALPRDKTAVAQKLFFHRMELETRLELLEDKKKKTDQLLNKLCVDGVLRVGSESVQIPSRKSNHWDYGKVHAILAPAGLWRESFGTIKASALQAAMVEFPADIRKRLEDAVVVNTHEPSISEAARHGRAVKQAPLLRGLS